MSETTTTNTANPPCANMPGPSPEHQWLDQFLGEWTSEAEINMDPSQPPMIAPGTESTRSLGGFWIVAEGEGVMEGMPPFHSRLSLGYDPQKGKYIGSWIDSMTSHLWQYEGTVDASGRILTLDTEGPDPANPGGVRKFKEVTEFKSPTHRYFTSSMVNDDGSLSTFVKVNFHKK